MSVLQLGCGIRPIEGAVNHDKDNGANIFYLLRKEIS